MKVKKFSFERNSFFCFEIAYIIYPILASLFSESVSEDVFLAYPKIARVAPIHKSGSQMEVKNYRSISTLPFVGKFFNDLETSLFFR